MLKLDIPIHLLFGKVNVASPPRVREDLSAWRPTSAQISGEFAMGGPLNEDSPVKIRQIGDVTSNKNGGLTHKNDGLTNKSGFEATKMVV